MAVVYDTKISDRERLAAKRRGGASTTPAPTLYGGISVPKFKDPRHQLYGELLKKQLGYVGDAATFYDNPENLTAGYWGAMNRDIAGDSTGAYLADITGDEGNRGAYDLARQNKATMGYNDLISSVYSPQGFGEIAQMKASLYGPETLSALGLFSPVQQQGPKGQGSFLNQALGVGATAAGLGWSPFGG